MEKSQRRVADYPLHRLSNQPVFQTEIPPTASVQRTDRAKKRKHYFRRSCTGESTSTAKRAHGEAHVPLRRKSCVRTEPEGGPTAIKKDSERTNYGYQAFATSPLGVRVSFGVSE